MNNRRLTAVMLTMVLAGGALAGCGSAAADSAAEETTGTTDAAAEETADDTAESAEAAENTETEAEDETFIPSDFVQERAGMDTFDSYDEIIDYLEGDEGYAYLSLDGSAGYVLGISDSLYTMDGAEVSGSISLYGYNSDGKLVNVGNAYASDEAYPLRNGNGILYVCNDIEYGETKISADTNGLFYTKLIDAEYAEDGSVSLSGFVREDDDINNSSEDIGISTEEEFKALYTAMDEVEPIHFRKAEYASYDEAIASLQSGNGYAYLTIDGYDGDVLAITDFTYTWDNGENASITAYLYVQDGDKAEYLGTVMDGGTNYPIRVENGVLYATGHAEYGEMVITQDDAGRNQLTYTKHAVLTYDADQKATVETEGDVSAATEDEFYALFDTVADMAPVNFQVAAE